MTAEDELFRAHENLARIIVEATDTFGNRNADDDAKMQARTVIAEAIEQAPDTTLLVVLVVAHAEDRIRAAGGQQ